MFSSARKRNFLRSVFIRSMKNGRYKSTNLSAGEIRKHFIDYFKSTGHSYIRSSPVRPLADPTLEFVNAGMNQFKNVFLGSRPPPTSRATNSQKCIRIGGKHNDLDVVGHDTYHHTFFEMLGNWSFGDYFKKEACEMAWKLITSPPYSLPVEKLYVTYFGGDSRLSLEPDIETRDIWRSLGVNSQRILPFGLKDNFWEMGLTGPCGPCTEIHYDHAGPAVRPHLVNKDLPDLTELWNLVFIKYKREEDGSLISLDQHFVDTGMGFERLVAILRGKSSNYDSDLFSPLFNQIQKVCKVPEYKGSFGSNDENGLDTKYRMLADHTRMATVAIADNIFPYQSDGLRRVLRKTFRIADSLLPGGSLKVVTALSKVVSCSLEGAYPEVGLNGKQVDYVIQDEHELWQRISASTKKDWDALLASNRNLEKLTDVVSPGLIAALKELEKTESGERNISDTLALTLFDRFGIDVPLIEELATLRGGTVDIEALKKGVADLKSENKKALHDYAVLSNAQNEIKDSVGIPFSDDSLKYNYTRSQDGKYSVDPIVSNVAAFLSNGCLLSSTDYLENNCEISVVLEETNCWSSLKGDTDVGRIEFFENGEPLGWLMFNHVSRAGNFIVHRGIFSCSSDSGKCRVGKWKAKVQIDVENRIALMRNVTSSHLLAQSMREKYVGHMSHFSNSRGGFAVKFIVYDPNISEAGLILLEHSVNLLVRRNLPISVVKISLNELLGNDNISIPQTINRSGSHFPLIQLQSDDGEELVKEVSYGPNLLNTGDIQEFCLVDVNFSRKQKEVTMKCISGPIVESAYRTAENLLTFLGTIDDSSSVQEMDIAIARAKSSVVDNLIPICYRVELNHLVRNIDAMRKSKSLQTKTESMKDAIARVEKSGLKYLVHYAGENTKLEKLTRTCQNVPVMLFAYNNGHLTARCCTPVGSEIDADAWISKIAKHLGTEPSYYKGHDCKRMCGLKPVKMNKSRLAEIDELKKIAEQAVAR